MPFTSASGPVMVPQMQTLMSVARAGVATARAASSSRARLERIFTVASGGVGTLRDGERSGRCGFPGDGLPGPAAEAAEQRGQAPGLEEQEEDDEEPEGRLAHGGEQVGDVEGLADPLDGLREE